MRLLQVYDYVLAVLSLVFIITIFIECAQNYKNANGQQSKSSKMLRMVFIGFTLIGWLLIYLRTKAKMGQLYRDKMVYSEKSIVKAGLLKHMIFEMMVFALHPPLYFDVQFIVKQEGQPVDYNLSIIIATFSILKMYFVLRILPYVA